MFDILNFDLMGGLDLDEESETSPEEESVESAQIQDEESEQDSQKDFADFMNVKPFNEYW